MKIIAVRTIALAGATDDHGWPGGTDPNVQYNTLGGSGERRRAGGTGQLLHHAAAGRRLAGTAQAAFDRAIGARAAARQRDAAAVDVLAGSRRLGRTYDQRARHRAVGFVGQGAGSAGVEATGRQLSRPHQAVRVDAVRRSAGAGRQAARANVAAAFAPSRWAGDRSAA